MSDTSKQISETNMINLNARSAAHAAIEGQHVSATGQIQYQSQGSVLVIGGQVAQEFATRLGTPLRAQVLLTEGEIEPGVPVIAVGGRPLQVDGYLGHFVVSLGEEGKPSYETMQADMILDLGEQPLLSMPLKPPGYFVSGCDEPELSLMAQQLETMVGRFEKPRYFSYDASICAHGRSGQAGCNRCVETCPAEAITGLTESIEVNPYLCQGGGVCASVCPSGAIRYNYPSAADMQNRLRQLLSTYYAHGGQQAVVVFVAEADALALAPVDSNVLVMVVEELASVGLDGWLAALAYGARAVQLVNAGSVPEQVLAALHEQVSHGQAVLTGLGYPAKSLQIVTGSTVADDMDYMPAIEAARHVGLTDKRQAIYLALDHLYQHATHANAVIPLSAGAPFGVIHVSDEACTLCLSCTSVCPVSAVQAGNDKPQLVFHEARCVQCGICASACPEQAITLQPRLVADAERRKQATVIQEEAPFACVSCGKPFATSSVINHVLARLEGHSMFQSERARQRLMMCDDCRVVDIVQDNEAMQQSGPVPRH